MNSVNGIRGHRVAALCDWIGTIPASPPFHTHPGFRFFADLTDEEMDAAGEELTRRGDAAMAEADALRAEQCRRASRDRAGD